MVVNIAEFLLVSLPIVVTENWKGFSNKKFNLRLWVVAAI
jgi:hypothetical protein